MAHSAGRWNLGAVTSTKIFDALSVRTGMAREQVEAHARRCCEQLVFNETAWRVVKERWLPQALVTVNPDLFTDHIVPVHGLTAVFDVIVVSSAEGTDDKSDLCDRALTRLGYAGARSAALLIDNRRDIVNAWIDTGGAGYLFHSDEQFRLATIPGGCRPLHHEQGEHRKRRPRPRQVRRRRDVREVEPVDLDALRRYAGDRTAPGSAAPLPPLPDRRRSSATVTAAVLFFGSPPATDRRPDGWEGRGRTTGGTP